jgi:FlaA1/EpsC-like NDP-sugar epimerase
MLAEEIVLRKRDGRGDFIVVRFGNVLGSRGSIVPLFKKQIMKGGPVTITHPKTTRFFMTIPEASSLVLKAGGVGGGGELYILDMGEPLSIQELAEQMIRFYGYLPRSEIPINYIGLRPGEKLNETLWAGDEQPVRTEYPRINRIPRVERFNGNLQHIINSLRPICFFDSGSPHLYRNRLVLRKLLHSSIPSVSIPDNEPEY